jgi:hypothetical protein
MMFTHASRIALVLRGVGWAGRNRIEQLLTARFGGPRGATLKAALYGMLAEGLLQRRQGVRYAGLGHRHNQWMLTRRAETELERHIIIVGPSTLETVTSR